jgi:hypothetical protein
MFSCIEEDNLRIIKENSAATLYDTNTNSLLTIDWSYDGLYFKYGTEGAYITISLGPKMEKSEIHKLNTPEIISIFKRLCFLSVKHLKNYSPISDNALDKVSKVADLFV